MLRIKYTFGTLIFAALLILLAACSDAVSSEPQANSPPAPQAAQVKAVEVQDGAAPLVSTTTAPAASQAEPLPDVPSLLQSQCTRCHNARWLGQIKKSRADLEQDLERMVAKGVRLSETEKAALLDYLAVADK